MKNKILVATLGLGIMTQFAGCNSETSQESSVSGVDNQRIISGKVADGYLQGVTVCMDVNENEICDPGEPMDITSSDGSYLLNVSPTEFGPILAEVPADAIDSDTGNVVGGVGYNLKGNEKNTFISPISTMIMSEIEENGLSYDAAKEKIAQTFSFNKDNIDKDYIKYGKDRSELEKIHDTAVVIATSMKERMHQYFQNENKAELSEEDRNRLSNIVHSEMVKNLTKLAVAISDDGLNEASLRNPNSSLVSIFTSSPLKDTHATEIEENSNNNEGGQKPKYKEYISDCKNKSSNGGPIRYHYKFYSPGADGYGKLEIDKRTYSGTYMCKWDASVLKIKKISNNNVFYKIDDKQKLDNGHPTVMTIKRIFPITSNNDVAESLNYLTVQEKTMPYKLMTLEDTKIMCFGPGEGHYIESAPNYDIVDNMLDSSETSSYKVSLGGLSDYPVNESVSFEDLSRCLKSK